MRQVDRRLDELAQGTAADFIQQQGDDDRHRKDEDDLQRRDDQRIGKHLPEDRRGKQRLEMLEADPEVRADDAQLLEGDLGFPDRQVMEDDEEDEAGRHHHIIGPPLADALAESASTNCGNVPTFGRHK